MSRFETIDEAINYQSEGKYDIVVKMLMDVHAKLNNPPESQVEIVFYQKYGNMLKDAENLLQNYRRYRDPMAMYQAFDIYLQLHTILKESMKELETVALHYLDSSKKYFP